VTPILGPPNRRADCRRGVVRAALHPSNWTPNRPAQRQADRGRRIEAEDRATARQNDRQPDLRRPFRWPRRKWLRRHFRRSAFSRGAMTSGARILGHNARATRRTASTSRATWAAAPPSTKRPVSSDDPSLERAGWPIHISERVVRDDNLGVERLDRQSAPLGGGMRKMIIPHGDLHRPQTKRRVERQVQLYIGYWFALRKTMILWQFGRVVSNTRHNHRKCLARPGRSEPVKQAKPAIPFVDAGAASRKRCAKILTSGDHRFKKVLYYLDVSELQRVTTNCEQRSTLDFHSQFNHYQPGKQEAPPLLSRKYFLPRKENHDYLQNEI
jgi:hypothetical protein